MSKASGFDVEWVGLNAAAAAAAAHSQKIRRPDDLISSELYAPQ